MHVTFTPATPADLDRVVALKKRVMHDELVRVLGSWSDERSRSRVAAHFSPAWTRMIRVDGADVGTITLRPDAGVTWLEMFYLSPEAQGRGIGSAVLRTVLEEFAGRTLRLEVLVDARVRALYERHGFALISSDGIDDVLERVG